MEAFGEPYGFKLFYPSSHECAAHNAKSLQGSSRAQKNLSVVALIEWRHFQLKLNQLDTELLLANAAILPQARQGSYFFNRADLNRVVQNDQSAQSRFWFVFENGIYMASGIVQPVFIKGVHRLQHLQNHQGKCPAFCLVI